LVYSRCWIFHIFFRYTQHFFMIKKIIKIQLFACKLPFYVDWIAWQCGWWSAWWNRVPRNAMVRVTVAFQGFCSSQIMPFYHVQCHLFGAESKSGWSDPSQCHASYSLTFYTTRSLGVTSQQFRHTKTKERKRDVDDESYQIKWAFKTMLSLSVFVFSFLEIFEERTRE